MSVPLADDEGWARVPEGLTMQPTDPSNALTAALAEYSSLRDESLRAIQNRISVLTFTFAALAAVTAGLLAGRSPAWLSAFVGCAVMPQLAKAALYIWLGEHERSQRAGAHLRMVEETVNRLTEYQAMSWERSLVAARQHMVRPYQATMALLLGAGYVGVALGIAGLWSAPHTTAWHVFAPTLATASIVWEVVFLFGVALRSWRQIARAETERTPSIPSQHHTRTAP